MKIAGTRAARAGLQEQQPTSVGAPCRFFLYESCSCGQEQDYYWE
jgi:hypothetical protein